MKIIIFVEKHRYCTIIKSDFIIGLRVSYVWLPLVLQNNKVTPIIGRARPIFGFPD